MNNFGKNLALWLVIGLLLIALFNLFQGTTGRTPPAPIAYSDFLAELDKKQVKEVKLQDETLTGTLTDGREFKTYIPDDPTLVPKLEAAGVRLTVEPEDEGMNPILSALLQWFPMLLLIGVWIFFMRQMQSGGGRAMGFGKSRARLLTE